MYCAMYIHSRSYIERLNVCFYHQPIFYHHITEHPNIPTLKSHDANPSSLYLYSHIYFYISPPFSTLERSEIQDRNFIQFFTLHPSIHPSIRTTKYCTYLNIVLLNPLNTEDPTWDTKFRLRLSTVNNSELIKNTWSHLMLKHSRVSHTQTEHTLNT